jgi:chromosome segregation ATPase
MEIKIKIRTYDEVSDERVSIEVRPGQRVEIELTAGSYDPEAATEVLAENYGRARNRVAQLETELARSKAQVEHLEHERKRERERAEANREWAERAEAQVEKDRVESRAAAERSADNFNQVAAMRDDAVWHLNKITRVIAEVDNGVLGGYEQDNVARDLTSALRDIQAALIAERPA